MARRLLLYNSLTQKKEIFAPLRGPAVTWYCCGPTVYDAAHMGHARSYISFDIIRRVLLDYFNYSVIFVMNITDIDDKIISRARKEFLWQNFFGGKIANGPDNPLEKAGFLETVKKARECFVTKIENTFDPDAKIYHLKRLELFNESVKNGKLDEVYGKSKDFFEEFKDVFTNYLDVTKGHEITHHEIYTSLTRKFEKDFLDDLKSLEILPPTFMPRVTEFVDNIIKYVCTIIENGFAYISNGSVYFDTIKFSQTHKYAKLVPTAAFDLNSLAIGEGIIDIKIGELSSNIHLSEKRSSRDFALWKVSKPGEPFWNSPWGKGRPGWHIECSTMCHEILPSQIDIHSGGVDLKFPHHDNEISQSEAFYNSNDWVSVFLHAGHLTIEGCKMSKSLKNFITIKDALKLYTPRQIRLLFLTHQWNGPLDFGSNVMIEACSLDKKISDFISRVNSLIHTDSEYNNIYNVEEKQLQEHYIKAHENIDIAICDNIDTPEAITQLKNLISYTYTYIASKSNKNLHKFLLQSILKYIIKILSIFGANYSEYDISTNQSENVAISLAHKVAQFRSDVRKVGFDTKNNNLFYLCDKFRDIDLFELGIKLEDTEEKCTVIMSSKEQLEKEREEKNKVINKITKMAVLKKQAELNEKARQKQLLDDKNQKASVPPSKMFIDQTDKYSQFDSEGVPTFDNNGQPISKSAMKKIMKLYEKQKSIYEKYVAEKGQ